MNRFLKSFEYAWNGIKMVFNSEPNMKFHFAFAILVLIFGFLLKISVIEWTIVALCIGLVFISEMFNTAIEYLVDKISPEKNPVAGKIKDIAAGAVLISAIISAIVGLIIFVPKIIAFLLILLK